PRSHRQPAVRLGDGDDAAGVSTTVGSWTGQGATSVRSSWNDRGAGTVGGVATAIPPASPLPGAAR
ncbi:hypothetical protein ACWD95_35175, partial [Streptomyces sp. NPDC005069]